MSDPIRYLQTGEPVFCGLQVPEKKPCRLPLYQDRASLLTLDQIRQIIASPTRQTAEELFPARTWIGRQLNNGCNGWAAAAALGRARVRRGNKPVVLSGDFVYSHINGGRDQGSMLDDGMQFIEEFGSCEDRLVKHGTWQARNISNEAKENAKRFKGVKAYQVAEEIELLTGLARGLCGVVAVQVPRNGYDTDGTGTVYATDGPGNHAVAVDDLRIFDGRGQLQIRSPNSWGLSWGQNGVGWLEWSKHLRTSSNSHDFYLIGSTIDDPVNREQKDIQ